MSWKSKYNSQRGAALLLSLFIIALISIVGVGMLSVTLYSQKSINSNTTVQGEFYRAEGALEIVIDEMRNYNGGQVPLLYEDGTAVENRMIDRKGPYFYLEDNQLPSTKLIGGKDVEVEIQKTKIDEKNYRATLNASYLEGETRVTRSLNLNVTRENKPVIPKQSTPPEFVLDRPIHFVSNFNYNGGIHDDELKLYLYDQNAVVNNKTGETARDRQEIKIASVPYNRILNELGYHSPSYTNAEINSSHTFSPGFHNPHKIVQSGQASSIVVAEGAKVFTKHVELHGSGGQKHEGAQLTVNGILVTEELNMSGNSTLEVNGILIVRNNSNLNSGELTINSGIITNNFSKNGNIALNGEAKGFNCSLINMNCSSQNNVPIIDLDTSDYSWNSSLQILNFKTTR
ncbi:hypothetical protein [Alkalihalobacterium sp. APHAB7]|uniref:hypothetical protein n=1 Tax=Alkalihalobacterium sp. APHAB7 TaxID=3402081 RepID=UPI003AAC72BB